MVAASTTSTSGVRLSSTANAATTGVVNGGTSTTTSTTMRTTFSTLLDCRQGAAYSEVRLEVQANGDSAEEFRRLAQLIAAVAGVGVSCVRLPARRLSAAATAAGDGGNSSSSGGAASVVLVVRLPTAMLSETALERLQAPNNGLQVSRAWLVATLPDVAPRSPQPTAPAASSPIVYAVTSVALLVVLCLGASVYILWRRRARGGWNAAAMRASTALIMASADVAAPSLTLDHPIAARVKAVGTSSQSRTAQRTGLPTSGGTFADSAVPVLASTHKVPTPVAAKAVPSPAPLQAGKKKVSEDLEARLLEAIRKAGKTRAAGVDVPAAGHVVWCHKATGGHAQVAHTAVAPTANLVQVPPAPPPVTVEAPRRTPRQPARRRRFEEASNKAGEELEVRLLEAIRKAATTRGAGGDAAPGGTWHRKDWGRQTSESTESWTHLMPPSLSKEPSAAVQDVVISVGSCCVRENCGRVPWRGGPWEAEQEFFSVQDYCGGGIFEELGAEVEDALDAAARAAMVCSRELTESAVADAETGS